MADKVVVVIPAYNEEQTIRDVSRRALQQCADVIVVDDGSTDGTAAQVRDLPVFLLRNEENLGKAASLWVGIETALAAGARAVITLDADGQHRPEDIPRLIDASRSHPRTIIIGARLAHKSDIPAKRYIANKIANFWISWAAGYAIEDSQSGFRLYPASLLRELEIAHDKSHGFVLESEVLIEAARAGYKSVPVPISAIYAPGARASHFRPVRDVVRITQMVTVKLLSRGLNPAGFVRAFVLPRIAMARLDIIGADGFLTLVVSNLVMLLSFGLSLAWVFRRVVDVAARSPACDETLKVLFVLGMRLQDNAVGPDYRKRLDKAVELYHRINRARIWVLGGRTRNSTYTEADRGRLYLIEQGVSADAIVVEDASRHTLENLRHARTLLQACQDQTVLIITNRYHLARSHAFADGMDIGHRLCAAENRLAFNLRSILLMLREAYYLHWYHVGKAWSLITRNRKSLSRIT